MSTLTASLQNGALAFWRWWRHELTQLLPASLRARLQHRHLLPVMAYDGLAWSLWLPVLEQGRAKREKKQTFEAAGDPEVLRNMGSAAVRQLASPLALALPPAMVLRRTLTLPLALEENLKQALAYDLDRHTPFRADELYFDAQVTGRDPVRGEIKVELAAARRGDVDRLLGQLREWGGEVVAILVDAPDKADARLNLLPSESRPVWSGWQRWAVAGGTGLIVLLLIATIAFPVWQKRGLAVKLRKDAEAIRGEAMGVEQLHNELDRLVADYDFVLTRKETYPPTVQILDDISRLLPDDTWLTQMEVKTAPGGKDNKEIRREVFLRGESTHAGRLVTLLEESGLVTQAAPRSPITAIRQGQGQEESEMFDIGAQIKRLPLPERVAVSVAAAPAQPPAPQQPAQPAGQKPPAQQVPSPAAAPTAAPATATPATATPATATPATATPATATPATATPATATPATATPATATPATATPATPAASTAKPAAPAPESKTVQAPPLVQTPAVLPGTAPAAPPPGPASAPSPSAPLPPAGMAPLPSAAGSAPPVAGDPGGAEGGAEEGGGQ